MFFSFLWLSVACLISSVFALASSSFLSVVLPRLSYLWAVGFWLGIITIKVLWWLAFTIEISIPFSFVPPLVGVKVVVRFLRMFLALWWGQGFGSHHLFRLLLC